MEDLEKQLNQLAKDFDKLAQIPQKELGQAVKTGAATVLRSVRVAAPVRFGTLRGGLKLHKERSRTAGKVIYDVYPDPKMSDVFQKPIKKPVRTKGKHAYYPASQEYGFFTRRPDGGMTYTRKTGESIKLDKVPGKHYMRVGAEISGEAAKNQIAGRLIREIEKEFEG